MHILYVKGRCTTKRFPGNLYPKVLVARVPHRWTDIGLDLNPFRKRDFNNRALQVELFKGFFLGMKMMILIDYSTLTPLFFHVYPANVHESRIYLILELLKRRKLIRFGDSIIIEGFYAYKNYLIGIRYGVVSLIIPKKDFGLKGL